MAEQLFRNGSSSSSSSSFSYGFPYSSFSGSASSNAMQSPDQRWSGGSAVLSSPFSSSFSDGYSPSELSSFNDPGDFSYDGDSPSLPGIYQKYSDGDSQSMEQYGATGSNHRAANHRTANHVHQNREMFADAESWELVENAAGPNSVCADSVRKLSCAHSADDMWDSSETCETQNRVDGSRNERSACQPHGHEPMSSPALIFPNFCFLDGCRRDYVFPTYQSWRSHTKNVHNKVIFCPEPLCTCGPFPNKTGLTRHIQSVHKPYKPYRCMKTTCPRSVKAWSRKDKLRDHNKKYHSNFRCFFFSHNPNHERWFDTDQEWVQHTLSEHPGPCD